MSLRYPNKSNKFTVVRGRAVSVRQWSEAAPARGSRDAFVRQHEWKSILQINSTGAEFDRLTATRPAYEYKLPDHYQTAGLKILFSVYFSGVFSVIFMFKLMFICKLA